MSKMTRLFGSVIFAAVLLLGVNSVSAQASSLTSIQIQSILSLLSAFGADSATITSVNTALNGGTPTTSGGGTAFCYNFNSDLSVGGEGIDGSNGVGVDALVKILIKEVPSFVSGEGAMKGFFTEDVAEGVVKFQAKYGIKQTGYVGPITRAKLNALYGCSTTIAPTPTAKINGSCGAARYSCYSGNSTLTTENTTGYSWFCFGLNGGGTASCAQGKSISVIATSTISVIAPAGGQDIAIGSTYTVRWTSTGVNNVTLSLCSYSGSCSSLGGIPSSGISASTGAFNWRLDPNDPHYGSNLRIKVTDVSSGISGYSGYFEVLDSAPVISSISPSSGTVGTTVTIYGTNIGLSYPYNNVEFYKNGQYVATLSASSVIAQNQSVTFTITNAIMEGIAAGAYQIKVGTSAGMSSNAANFTLNASATPTPSIPVISGVSGPTSLQTGQSGLWTVHATDPNAVYSALGYSIEWGDGTVQGGTNVTSTGVGPQVQSFAHTYSKGGTYNPIFTVQSGSGGIKKSGTSVVVSGTVSTTSPVPTVSIGALPSTVVSGKNVILIWNSTNATSCTAPSGNWSNWTSSGGLSGTIVTSTLTQTTTFTLQCTGPGGTASASATVTVTPNQTASALNAVEGLNNSQQQKNLQYTWNTNLQIGSSNSPDISALQVALTNEGLYAGEITGGFYNQTFTAVRAFQQKYDIDSTGFVGPATREKLNSLY
ncbi:MAG: peptidoglycan-binding domain-containing protein [Candidatus Paceibacterota bacterium]